MAVKSKEPYLKILPFLSYLNNGGDAGFSDSDIYAEHNGNVFNDGYGRNALRNFHHWFSKQMSYNP